MSNLILGAVAGLLLGVLIGWIIAQKYYLKLLREPFKKEGLTEEQAVKKYMVELAYECPSCVAMAGEFCYLYDQWMCKERIHYAEEMENPAYDYVLSYNQTPKEPGLWEEVEIQNACGYGCKIYQHRTTGKRALMHNSAYGCRS